MHHDCRGLPLTAESAETAARFDAIVDAYLRYELSVPKMLKAMLDAEPGFAMGQCLRGYVLMMLGTSAIIPKVREAAATARDLLGDATPRERLHVDALDAWADGDILRAGRVWDQILAAHPTDLLALRLHHFTTFWTGRNYVLRNTVAGVLDAWDRSTPGYGYVLGMFAFGLEECGDFDRAEKHGRHASELNREDLWAIHAVAHVLEMQGRLEEGTAWLDRPADDFDGKNPFQGHVWWHAGLFAVERGDHDRALALYDDRIRAANTEFYLDIQNMASLLKRLELLDVDVGTRWEELTDYAVAHRDDHMLPFTDVHACLSLAAGGKLDAARDFIAGLRDFGNTDNNFAASTMDPVTVPLCEALVAYEDGDHVRATETLMAIRHDLSPIGGSHAQRDLFHQILLDAAFRAGHLEAARMLVSERVSLRPGCKTNWIWAAKIMEALGDAGAAVRARVRAEAIH